MKTRKYTALFFALVLAVSGSAAGFDGTAVKEKELLAEEEEFLSSGEDAATDDGDLIPEEEESGEAAALLSEEVLFEENSLLVNEEPGSELAGGGNSSFQMSPLSLSEHSLKLPMGNKHKLTAMIMGEAAWMYQTDEIVWHSSNESLAKVSADGTVTAVAPGRVFITAEIPDSYYNGGTVSDFCMVLVQFTDVVKEDAYYYDPVYWALDQNITTGLKDSAGRLTGKFAPKNICTREQIVTFLWRMMGSPKPTSTAAFKDVKKGAYYADAVSWAAANKITTGVSKDRFGVGEPCTRGMCVTFLYRAAGSPDMSHFDTSAASVFTDVEKDKYYSDAIVWALQYGITTGYKDDAGNPTYLFGVNDACERGHIVTFLQRFSYIRY